MFEMFAWEAMVGNYSPEQVLADLAQTGETAEQYAASYYRQAEGRADGLVNGISESEFTKGFAGVVEHAKDPKFADRHLCGRCARKFDLEYEHEIGLP